MSRCPILDHPSRVQHTIHMLRVTGNQSQICPSWLVWLCPALFPVAQRAKWNVTNILIAAMHRRSRTSCSVALILSLYLLVLTAAGNSPSDSPLSGSNQLILVLASDWNSTQGTARLFERQGATSKWKAAGRDFPIVLGKTGLAWGDGEHTKSVIQDGFPIKKEGDGKAPAGVFRLDKTFGYSAPLAGMRMPYVQLSNQIQCVDDPRSKYYNTLEDARTIHDMDWNSHEDMRRDDDLYRWGIVVGHNANLRQPEAGSCIFLHIWRGPDQPTAGCTAMTMEQMIFLLKWLNPEKHPILVQLPEAEYLRLRTQWGLPKSH